MRLGECFSSSALVCRTAGGVRGATAFQSNPGYFIASKNEEFALSEVVLAGGGEGVATRSEDLGRY